MNELPPPPSQIDILKKIGDVPKNSSEWLIWFNNLRTWVIENMSKDFMISVAEGRENGYSTVHKFGRNTGVTSTLSPVSYGGVYQTPTSAVSLEFVSSSAADALNGVGMHEITVIGLDANWEEQTVTTSAHATDGTIAVNITGTWLRVYRAYVSSSGAYASSTTASHVGTITIRVQGAGATYAIIPLEGAVGLGQTQIGVYTVPAGYSAYIMNMDFSSDVAGSKTANFYLFKRENADDVTSSYSGTFRIQQAFIGTQGLSAIEHKAYEKLPEKTDIGFMAISSGTSDCSVEFELLLVKN